MNRNSLSTAASSVLLRWHEVIVERFSKHPFPPPPIRPALDPAKAHDLTWERLQRLDELQFGHLVTSYFTAVGFRAQPRRKADAETVLFHQGDALPFGLVQRKWHILETGAGSVQELQLAMTAEALSEGYIVATGTFTPEARACDTGRRIMLLDGYDFVTHFNRLPKTTRAAILGEPTELREVAQRSA